MKSCPSRFKSELLQDGIFETIEDAHTEIFEYIEMYYNTIRLHSSLNYQSPLAFEKQYEQGVYLKCTERRTRLYTEESPLVERGIEPPSTKHRTKNSTLPKE